MKKLKFVPVVKYDQDGAKSIIWIEHSEGLIKMIQRIANIALADSKNRQRPDW